MNILLFAVALKVLAVGNSFSVSTQHQLPLVAKDLGCELDLVTMTIGGCPLERTYKCATSPKDLSYSLQWNRCGVANAPWPELSACLKPTTRPDRKTKKPVEVKGANLSEVLKAAKWDIITIQQASAFSWQAETYQPSGDRLVARIRELAPQAEIVVQETWSYTPWDSRLAKWKIDQNEMYAKLHDAYVAFAGKHGFRLIPMGAAVQLVRKDLPVKYTENSLGGDVVGYVKFKQVDGKWKAEGDFCHLGHDGHYLQGLVWAAKLFGKDVTKCTYAPSKMAPDRAAFLRATAMKAVCP